MKPSTLVLGGACGILVVGLVFQNRSASQEQGALVAELVRTSNDWKQAVVKLDEQGRLAYTLQTQLKLLQEDHLLATNELPKVRGALSTLESNHVSSVEQARSVSNRLQLSVLELIDERGDHTQRLAQAQSKLLSTEKQLSSLSNELTSAIAKLNAASNSMRAANTAKSQLEEQLRDPMILSAQLERYGEGAKDRKREVGKDAEKLRLELLPDGSVKQIP